MSPYWVLVAHGFLCLVEHTRGASSNSTTKKRASDDYYQINYDYEIFNNNKSLDVDVSSDSLILPIPEEVDGKETETVANIDDMNFNDDLKDHDLIDNLMFIYHDNGNKNGRYTYASEIIIGGSVLSFVAQISTILIVSIKKDINHKKDLKELFLHLICSLCMSNVAFMFGIFRTKHYIECLMIALLLTYLHLITAIWIFLYCFHIYKVFCENERLKREYFYFCGYAIPILYLLVSFSLYTHVHFAVQISFISVPRSYETRKFCFISVQRGMILNYMPPILCLMSLTAIYCLKGIYIFNMELRKLRMNSNIDSLTLYNDQMEIMMGRKCGNIDSLNIRGSKSCLRRLCAVQITYDILWFFLVLALDEIKDGSSLAVIYAFTTCCLNWYIFVETKIFFPTQNKQNQENTEKTCNGLETSDSSPSSSDCKPCSSDSVPLLIESTELKVLYYNPNISTISN